MLRQGSGLVYCLYHMVWHYFSCYPREVYDLLPRCRCRVTIRHQCLVVSLVIEVLPISSCVALSCGLL
jgi:hypothetical protein